MKLYYFHLDTNRVNDVLKRRIRSNEEGTSIMIGDEPFPIVVIKTDENIVEDLISHESYALMNNMESKDISMLKGTIGEEIKYFNFGTKLDIIGEEGINEYKSFISTLRNEAIEREENVREIRILTNTALDNRPTNPILYD